jgi:hypothetical protein
MARSLLDDVHLRLKAIPFVLVGLGLVLVKQ